MSVICKYYKSSRGCRKGAACRFLHQDAKPVALPQKPSPPLKCFSCDRINLGSHWTICSSCKTQNVLGDNIIVCEWCATNCSNCITRYNVDACGICGPKMHPDGNMCETCLFNTCQKCSKGRGSSCLKCCPPTKCPIPCCTNQAWNGTWELEGRACARCRESVVFDHYGYINTPLRPSKKYTVEVEYLAEYDKKHRGHCDDPRDIEGSCARFVLQETLWVPEFLDVVCDEIMAQFPNYVTPPIDSEDEDYYGYNSEECGLAQGYTIMIVPGDERHVPKLPAAYHYFYAFEVYTSHMGNCARRMFSTYDPVCIRIIRM